MDIQLGMQLTMPSTHGLILRPDLRKMPKEIQEELIQQITRREKR